MYHNNIYHILWTNNCQSRKILSFRLSSSRAFGHIGQQLGAILSGPLQHIQPPPTWSRPSANPAGKFCATSSWGVLLYACHPLESRILPLSPLDDLVSEVSDLVRYCTTYFHHFNETAVDSTMTKGIYQSMKQCQVNFFFFFSYACH